MTRTSITLDAGVLRTAGMLLAGLIGLLVGMTAAAGGAGATVQDAAYSSIAPCVSFDSRSDGAGLGGSYAHGEVRTFQITGPAPAAQMGGVDCGVPAGADAVLINIVAIQPSNNGNLRSYAAGTSGSGGVVNYSPVVPTLNNSNAVVIPLSAAGQLAIENNCGGCAGTSAHARGIVLGYFTDDLAARVAALEALLADVTRDNGGPGGTDRLLFSGMNVQVVDGTGDTRCTGDDLSGGTTGSGEACNGTGNVIVGYNEDAGANATRTGAHSVIVGAEHTWTAFGHVVAGDSNTATNGNASVLGGQFNRATGLYTTVTGGFDNESSGFFGTVSGGQGNAATGFFASVLGGENNDASGSAGTVAGGNGNVASGNDSAVAGGRTNTASGETSVVSGGRSNQAVGQDSATSGGHENRANARYSWVGGGMAGRANGERAAVVGGQSGKADGEGSSSVGGRSNIANGTHTVVVGGRDNEIDSTSSDSVIVGGADNEILTNASDSVIVGGSDNRNSARRSVVVGGLGNLATQGFPADCVVNGTPLADDYGVVAGGRNNHVSGCLGWIFGGFDQFFS